MLAPRVAPDAASSQPWRTRVAAILGRHPGAFTLAAYVVGAAAVMSNAWRSPFTTAPAWTVSLGNTFDPALEGWFLRWFPFALGHGQAPLVTNYIDYPTGVNLMWQASISLLSLVMAPVTLTLGPVLALNLLLTLAPPLSAWTAFLAIRRHVTRTAPAIAGGAVYGFSPFVMTHSLSHPLLSCAFLPPLVFLVLDEVLIRQRRPPLPMGLLLGALAGAQLFIGEEMLAITAVAAVVGTVVLALANVSEVRPRAPYAIRTLAIAGLVFAVVTAYPLAVQVFGPHRPQGSLQTPGVYVNDVFGLVVPTGLQLIQPGPRWWALRWFPGSMENATYLGLPLLAILYWMGRHRWASRTVRWASLTLLILWLFSLGTFLHVAGVITSVPLPWMLVSHIPALGHILPVRIMGVAFLLAALLLARFLDVGLQSSLTGTRRRMLAAGGLAMLALLPRPLPVVPLPTPAFFSGSGVTPIEAGSVVLVAPFASAANGSAAMGWQAQAGMRFRMPEGYAYGQNWLSPPASRMQSMLTAIQLYADRPPLPPAYRTQLLSELRQWRVRTVIVGPMDNEDAMVDFMTRLLGRPPAETGGVFVWSAVDQP